MFNQPKYIKGPSFCQFSFIWRAMVTQFCCCCENVKAAKILGIIGVIFHAILTLYFGYACFESYRFEPILVMVLVAGLTGLFANVSLVYGLMKKKQSLVLVWIVFACVNCILLIVRLSMEGREDKKFRDIIGLGFFIWQFLTVYGAYQEIKEDETVVDTEL